MNIRVFYRSFYYPILIKVKELVKEEKYQHLSSTIDELYSYRLYLNEIIEGKESF